jgi:hypothetical protein
MIDVRGDFTFRGARILDIPVPKLSGKITADPQGVRFESIDGDLFGYETRQGQRFSLGKINPETSRLELFFDEGAFDVRLRVQDANLPAAIRALGGNPRQVNGTFRTSIDLSGIARDQTTWRGQGDLALRARNVVSLPMFYRMFNSLDVLSMFERTDPWTKVDVDFGVKERILTMPRIRVDSPDIVLQGPGTLTFDGVVRADLKANQGVGISPIGWVTRLVSHVVFSGVRIDGPIGDPRVSPYSLAGG